MAALATMLAMTTILTTASCDDDDDNAVGQPVLLVSDLASSAHYGDSIFLSVACSDAEGVGLSTLKAYLEYSGQQVSTQTIRTRTETLCPAL